jgi:hypothetical protein
MVASAGPDRSLARTQRESHLGQNAAAPASSPKRDTGADQVGRPDQAVAAIRRAGVRVIVDLRTVTLRAGDFAAATLTAGRVLFAIGLAAERIERTAGLAAPFPAVRCAGIVFFVAGFAAGFFTATGLTAVRRVAGAARFAAGLAALARLATGFAAVTRFAGPTARLAAGFAAVVRFATGRAAGRAAGVRFAVLAARLAAGLAAGVCFAAGLAALTVRLAAGFAAMVRFAAGFAAPTVRFAAGLTVRFAAGRVVAVVRLAAGRAAVPARFAAGLATVPARFAAGFPAVLVVRFAAGFPAVLVRLVAVRAAGAAATVRADRLVTGFFAAVLVFEGTVPPG